MCTGLHYCLWLIQCWDDILHGSFPKIFQPFPEVKEINTYVTAKLSHEMQFLANSQQRRITWQVKPFLGNKKLTIHAMSE
jgi:hypothetical protein